MDEMNRVNEIIEDDSMDEGEEAELTKALLNAIMELIDKCQTLDELRDSIKRIMDEQ